MNPKGLLERHRIIFQMAYGIILIILIPVLIAFNTIAIINKYNESIDVLIQREALSIGRIIYASLKKDLQDSAKLQSQLQILKAGNSQLLEINILRPADGEFRVVASSLEQNLHRAYSYQFYNLAFSQPDKDGLATNFWRFANQTESELLETLPGERFWIVAMPMSDLQGNKTALLSLKLSSEIVETLASENRNQSIYLLIFTVGIVIFFLMIVVRLWDYALLYRKIKEIDAMKDEFISMASHEVRTPVTAIIGYVSLMMKGHYGPVTDEMKRILSNIDTSANRLTALVSDLLEVGKIEQGKIAIKSQPTDVSPLIRKAIEDLQPSAAEKGLALSFENNNQMLPAIMVDPDKFMQIMMNLLGNAIKYTQKGSVEAMAQEKGQMLEIKVKDTGIGMSANERKSLFSKFYRIRNEKTERISGTGLGLWITQELIELMKGKIQVDSIENVGTQFTVSFPIHKR